MHDYINLPDLERRCCLLAANLASLEGMVVGAAMLDFDLEVFADAEDDIKVYMYRVAQKAHKQGLV